MEDAALQLPARARPTSLCLTVVAAALILSTGAEFEVLGRLVEDGSLLLADQVDVKWNDIFRPDQLEWPAFYSQVTTEAHCSFPPRFCGAFPLQLTPLEARPCQ